MLLINIGQYIRLRGDGQTCTSEGYSDITSKTECRAAFDALLHPGKTSTAHDNVDLVSRSSRPKGCYSECFSDSSGYFCRDFNSHATGNGGGVSVADKLYILCTGCK